MADPDPELIHLDGPYGSMVRVAASDLPGRVSLNFGFGRRQTDGLPHAYMSAHVTASDARRMASALNERADEAERNLEDGEQPDAEGFPTSPDLERDVPLPGLGGGVSYARPDCDKGELSIGFDWPFNLFTVIVTSSEARRIALGLIETAVWADDVDEGDPRGATRPG